MKKSYKITLLSLIISLLFLVVSSCQTPLMKENSKVIHLTLWHGLAPPPNRDVFEKLVQQFNQENPEIQVEPIFIGQMDQMLPKILTAIVGKATPDILSLYPQLTGQFVELEALIPLENWFDQLPLKSEIYPNLLDEFRLDGHLWAIPLYTSNLGIFYRPKLFQEAGVTKLPQTWEQMRAIAKQLTVDKNGDHRPEQYGMLIPFGKGEWSVFTWFPFLLSAEGNVVENHRPNLLNPGAIKALQFWQDLLKDGSGTLSAPERGYEEGDFISGRIAMQITGPWTYIMKSNIDYDVFPIPRDIKPATVNGTGTLFLMKTTPEKQKAALHFFEYILSQEFQTPWSIETGFLPVNIKSGQSQAYQEFIKAKPVMKVFLDQIQVAGNRPIIAGYNRLSDHLGRAIESSMLGKPVQEALAESQNRLDVIWKDK